MKRPFSTSTRAAHAHAQANADYFGVAYVCFFDSSGTYRCERYDPKVVIHNHPLAHRVMPQKQSPRDEGFDEDDDA